MGWFVGWLTGWMVGWSVGRLVDKSDLLFGRWFNGFAG